MRRWWPLFAAILIFSGQTAIAAEPAVPVEMTAKQVSPSVYYVEGKPGIATDNAGFVSNAGFVVTEAGVVVFDALGSPALAEKLVGVIRSITPHPVKTLVLSHFHADHAYGLQVFKALGAEIIASSGAREYLNSDLARQRLDERRQSLAPWVNEKTVLVSPDRYLTGDYRFQLGKHSFTVSNIGSAHSEGDMTMFVEPDRVLFSGDIIFEGRIPFLGSANTRNWLETLRHMQAIKVTAMIPGHGPASTDPASMLELTTNYLAFVREKMGAAVENWVSFDDAYEQTDWSAFMEYPAFLEANRRNAYAVFLSLEAEALQK